MSPKETAYIVERLAVRFMSMVADYERKLVEHRAAFGARTKADAKIIEGLRMAAKLAQDECKVLRALVVDNKTIMDAQRAGIDNLRNRLNALGIQAAKQAGEVLGMVEGEGLLGAAQRVVKERNGLLTQVQDQRAEFASALSERDALRVEVAALQERLRASIARGDFAEIEVAQLKAQTPKRSHPVAVGEYLRRLTGFSTTPAGEVAQVLHVDCDAPTTEYTVKRPNGQQGVWSESGCEPCDPPADHDTPAGKASALVAHPVSRYADTEPELDQPTEVERAETELNRAQWADRYERKESADDVRKVPHRLIADMSADHERKMAENRAAFGARTEADRKIIEGLRSDLAKERAEHQADADHLNEAAEIKVGDVVEVVSNKGIQTWESDIGSMGKVRDFEPIDDCNCVRLENLPGKRNALGGYVSLCDVRKVPQ